MYLLDTNVLSELRKGKTAKINPNVEKWAESVKLSDLYISVITLQEIQTGILLLERKDETQAKILQTWFNEYVRVSFKDRTLDVCQSVALLCSNLHVPNPRPYADSLISATAQWHGFSLVTRNIDDFTGQNINLINPWTANIQ